MLPTTTHQQNAVLSALCDGAEHWGRNVRAAIKKDGYKSTNASFYELMDRMEAAGLVEGKYAERNVLGQMSANAATESQELGRRLGKWLSTITSARLTKNVAKWE